MIAIIKIILVMLVLVGMVLLLLGINHLFCNHRDTYNDKSDADLRRNLEHEREVIPPGSLFSGFLAKEIRKGERPSRKRSISASSPR